MSPSRYGPGLLTPPSMSALPGNQLLHHSQITSLTNSMVHHHTAMTNGLNGLTNNNTLNTNNNHHGDLHTSNNNVKSMVSSNNSSSGSIPPSSPNNMTRSLTPGRKLETLLKSCVKMGCWFFFQLLIRIRNNRVMLEVVSVQLVQRVRINASIMMVSLFLRSNKNVSRKRRKTFNLEALSFFYFSKKK